MDNKELQDIYDKMHKQGPSSWTNNGDEERQTILDLGKPWMRLRVLEIGCGEGDLCEMMFGEGGFVFGIDYSAEAINKARLKHPQFFLNSYYLRPFKKVCDYKDIKNTAPWDRVVMQGVLEHLDDPFKELKWIIDNLLVEGGDIITSSPCFLNLRGLIWMALNMVGAVMSKTDLHYLNQWEFAEFCKVNEYILHMKSCDYDWGDGTGMLEDFKKRIPLAILDAGIPHDPSDIDKFLEWLDKATDYMRYTSPNGANMVYHIKT